MPVCTYFLEGTCTNERCPFRHVSVAPGAPVCRDFLQGFCPRGDTCPNKHTSVCPKFAADGQCEEGDRCRFYHPTKRTWTLARALKEVRKPLLNVSAHLVWWQSEWFRVRLVPSQV